MRRADPGLLVLVLVPLFAFALARPSRSRAAEPAPGPAYPPTRTTPTSEVLHGVTVRDPYRWLEDEKSPEVQAWMNAEDAFARKELAALPGRGALEARLKELLYVDSLGAPIHRGTRYFYSRRHASQEKSVVYWKEGMDGAEKVLLDPNAWSTDGSAGLGAWSVSWDGKSVAYGKKVNNSDEATLHVMDVATGKVSDVDVIEGAKYANASWTPDGSAFYYTKLPVDPKIPASERPGWADVRLHRIGTDPKTDVVVKEKLGDPTTFQNVEITRDGRFLFLVVSHGWTSTDVFFRDLEKDASASSWTPLAVGIKAHFNVDSFGRRLFVQTDDGAPKGRIFAVDPAKPARAAWKEIVPERRDAALQSFGVVGGRLALDYLRSASSLLEIRDLDGTIVREVPLPGIGSASNLSGRDDEDEAFFSFTSFTTPTSIYRTSVKTGATSLYFQVKVPADASPYTVSQVFYPSKDGTRVSMFIVHRKDLPRDGTARAMLEGYGGFLVSETPVFMASLFPWLERGGIYAVPNLRGGGEYGEEWHEAGMLLKKQNVFDDFAAAAAYLEKEKWTSPERLVLQGRLERRPPPRGDDHAAPRALPGRALRRPSPRHGAVPPLRIRQDVDLRVRLGGRRGAVPGALRLLSLPPREGGDEVPVRPPPVGGQRRPGRPHARAEVRGRAPGGDDRRPRAPQDREARGPRRRRPREGDRRVPRGRVRVRPRRDPRDRRGPVHETLRSDILGACRLRGAPPDP